MPWEVVCVRFVVVVTGETVGSDGDHSIVPGVHPHREEDHRVTATHAAYTPPFHINRCVFMPAYGLLPRRLHKSTVPDRIPRDKGF